MKKIKLANNKGITIVDNDDYQFLKTYRWYISGVGYVGNPKLGLIHRYIMNCPKGLQVHHVNHNPLDNRRRNLNICTHAENMRNRRPSRPPYKCTTNPIKEFIKLLIWKIKII